MMRKELFILFFILTTVIGSAQGIAGRRISLEGEFDYTMRYLEPTEHFFSIGGKVRAGYVASRHWQIYIGMNYYRQNYLETVVDSFHDPLGDATDYITCKELDITGRYFLTKFADRQYNCIAPDGKYVEVSVINSWVNYFPGELPYRWDITPLDKIVTTRLSVGVGNQQVWWNRVIVNTGILTSVPLYKWTVFDKRTAPYARWQTGHNAFRMYVSVGVLL